MSLTRLLRGATVGLALLACDVSPEPVQGCKTDYDCKDNRYCVNGQCQGNGAGIDGSGQSWYTCETACQRVIDCGFADPNIPDYFGYCTKSEYGCRGDNWSQQAIDCVSSASCDKLDDLCEKYIP